MTVTLHQGDCIEVMRAMPDNSVDSFVTDPPYGLSDHKPAELVACLAAWLAGEPYQPKGKGFMGKSWDAWVPGPEVWREALRILRPGGHLLAFAGTRSMDLMCMAVRLAGFEVRDAIGNATDGGGAPLMAWVYGSGFPKSHNLDGDWEGWGTALKPAWEPIILARKPLIGTVAANVLAHGTGALNIDGCRIGVSPSDPNQWGPSVPFDKEGGAVMGGAMGGRPGNNLSINGRWPANVIHDGSPEVLAAFPAATGQKADISDHAPSAKLSAVYEGGPMPRRGEASQDSDNEGPVGFKMKPGARRLDEGSAARFFYCAKASKEDRNEGCDGLPMKTSGMVSNTSCQHMTRRDGGAPGPTANHHPTVKPTDLCRYLLRLVTPPGGTSMDIFCGSGSFGKAAVLEGFNWIGIDLDQDKDGNPLGYLDIARARIEHAQRQGHQPSLLEAA